MPGDAPSINPDKAPAWAIGNRFWAPDFELQILSVRGDRFAAFARRPLLP